jgi:RHS repeat-associated protein
MTGRLFGRHQVVSRARLRAVALVSAVCCLLGLCAPGAWAQPNTDGGGVPAAKMFGYAAGPAQQMGTAAGKGHYVPASATGARAELGNVTGHAAPKPDLAPPAMGTSVQVTVGSGPHVTGHLVADHQLATSSTPAASTSPSPSASSSPSASPSPSASASGSASPSPSESPSPSASPSGSASPSPSESVSPSASATSTASTTSLVQLDSGGGTDNASYSVAASYDTVPMADQTGRIAVTLTNTGTSTWSGYALGSQVFPSGDTTGTGTPVTTGANVAISATVAPGGNATVESVTPAENPGSYEICWDMVNAAGTYFSAEGADEFCAAYTIQQYAPVINEQEPLPGTDVDAQKPTLAASAVVPGGYPATTSFWYAFEIVSGPNLSTATVDQSSGWVANNSNNWTPTTALTWGQTYYWVATVSDATTPPAIGSSPFTQSNLTWTTPISFVVGDAQAQVGTRLGNAYTAQDGNPVMTSDLGGTDYTGSGKTVDPKSGNVSMQATDASVATVGPALSVVRTYNSLDPRTSQAFGAGWSSVVDMSMVPDPDGSGALILTLANGQQVRFAKNASGGYAPPEDMYAVVTPLTGGGFSVTDQTGTTYDFGEASGSSWLISEITDEMGISETFSYTSGALTAVTNTSSGRALHFTWSTPSGASYSHVATVSTNPATAGQPSTALTWTYGYHGDLLTSVCSPVSTTQCTSYGYITNGSHAPTAVLNANPTSYYRLDDPAGATSAANQIPVNDLSTVNPPATEMNTTPGATGPVPGVTATSFNGKSSWIPLDGAWCTTPGSVSSCSTSVGDTGRVLGSTATSEAISVWFKTSTAGGVLLSADPVLPGSQCVFVCTLAPDPMLYIGSNGDLESQGCELDACITVLSSTTAVDNGSWHQAVLIPGQALYLDGKEVATSSMGLTTIDNPVAMLGAGMVASTCEEDCGSQYSWSYFNGSLADLSIYQDQLPSAGTVAAQYAAETTAAAELSSVTTPAGHTEFAATYDTVNDRVATVTDANGGTWTYSDPVNTASSGAYDNAVLSSSPEDFWPLNDAAGPLAHDMIGGAATAANPRPAATYANVTLGAAGPTGFSDGTAASFTGSGSQISIPGGYWAGTGAESVELWFNTTKSGTLLSSGAGPTGGNPVSLWVNGACLEGSIGATQLNIPEEPALCTAGSGVNNGKWHQAVLTLSPVTSSTGIFGTGATYSQTATLYLDGKSIATATASLVSASSTGYTAYIGNGSEGDFTGSIADVSFYTTELTSSNVTAHQSALAVASGVTSGLPSGVTAPVLNTQTITVTDPVGKNASYMYANGSLIQTTDVLGGTTSYGYDIDSRAATITDPDGDTTYQTYDAHNNVTSVTTCVAVNDCQTAYTSYYEDLANPLDPRNDKPTDSRNARSSSPTDPTYDTMTTYTPQAQVATVSTPATTACPAGCTTSYAYTNGTQAAVGGGTEPAGLAATITAPNGGVTSYEYDSAGDLMQVTDPLGLVTKYAYDNLGRVLTQTQISNTYPAGLTISYSYNGADQVLTETDPPITDRVTGAVHTQVTTYTYDPDGDVLTSTLSDATGGDPSRTTTDTYNSDDELASITDAMGNTTSYTYDALGDRITETNPAGVTTAYSYDAAGNLLSTTLDGYTGNPSAPIAPENLVEESRAYDPDGRLASVTNVKGTTTNYTYYGNGQLAASYVVCSSCSNGMEDETTYAYDAAGNQIAQTQPGGLVINSTYNADNQPVSQTVDPTGVDRVTTASYDADGDIVSESLSGGGVTQTETMTYNAMDEALSQTVDDSGGNLTTTYVRDERGLVTSETDPEGNTTSIQNDEAGRAVVVTDPAVQAQTGNGSAPVTANPVTTTGYDTFGDQVETEDADGNIAKAAFNPDGEEASVTDPSYTQPGSSTPVNGTTTMTYNSLGEETAMTDPLGNTTKMTYDQLGNEATETDPGGGVTTYMYDPAGEQISVTDPTGALTESTYDNLGRLLTSTDIVRQNASAAYTTTYGYNDAGDQISQTSPTGVQTTAAYDAVGEQTSSTDGAGNTTTYAYNLDGDLVKTTLPDGSATTATYDLAGRPISTSDLSSSGAVLRTESASYDPDGQITSTTDFNGNTSTATYDATGMLTSQTQPVSASKSITVGFGYDLDGNRTALTDGNGNTSYTTYNSLGLPQIITEPTTTQNPTAADSTTTDIYDGDGELTAQDLPGGVQLGNAYDSDGDLTSQSGSGASASTASRTFTYDAAGRLLTAGTGAAGTQGSPGYQPATSESFSYDDRGLLLSASGSAGTSVFTYNGSGQVTSDAEAAGTSTYTYNSAGLLATDADAASGVTGTYSYNNLDQVTGISYGSGHDTQSFGYDGLHRLASDTIATAGGAQVAAISYGYDNDDNVTSMTTSGLATSGGTGTVTNTYGYDEASRLTSWTATPSGGTATTKTYGYDNDGNMTNDNGVTNTFDARDELVSESSGYTFTYAPDGDLVQQGSSGGQTYSFTSDAYGQQITDRSSSYTWDALDRLVTDTAQTGGSIGLTYDGMTDEVASDSSATYSRDPAGQVTGVDSAAGGRVIALDDGHDDLSGVFTASGTTMAGSTTYDPWGQVLATSGPAIQVGYQGQWTDPATAQVDMGARFYSPANGSFINQDTDPDPADTVITSGLHAYADDNPMSLTDLTGHSPSASGSPSGPSAGQVSAAAARAAVARAKAMAAEAAATAARATAAVASEAAHGAAAVARALNTVAAKLAAAASKASQLAAAAFKAAQAELKVAEEWQDKADAEWAAAADDLSKSHSWWDLTGDAEHLFDAAKAAAEGAYDEARAAAAYVEYGVLLAAAFALEAAADVAHSLADAAALAAKGAAKAADAADKVADAAAGDARALEAVAAQDAAAAAQDDAVAAKLASELAREVVHKISKIVHAVGRVIKKAARVVAKAAVVVAKAVYKYSGAQDVVSCVTDPKLSSCVKAALTVALVVATGGEGEVEVAAVDAAEDAAEDSGDAALTLFRADSRGPEEIFSSGFEPKGGNMDLMQHALENPADSGYISTSSRLASAQDFAKDNGLDYIYKLRGSGIDVNAELGDESPFPFENEIAVPRPIPGSAIEGVWGPKGWIDNPGYKP